MEMDAYLTQFTKINSKWMKGLNIRPETVKLLEESIKRNLTSIDLVNELP
jgi:hypothetical protein